MKPLALAIVLFGCATIRTPEGERELTRNAIHDRLERCNQGVDLYSKNHGYNAMGYFWCGDEAKRDCLAAGLEPLCSEWQKGY